MQITQAYLKNRFKCEAFIRDARTSNFMREVAITSQTYVQERKPGKLINHNLQPRGHATYTILTYQKKNHRYRWHSISELSLKEVVFLLKEQW